MCIHACVKVVYMCVFQDPRSLESSSLQSLGGILSVLVIPLASAGEQQDWNVKSPLKDLIFSCACSSSFEGGYF